MSLEALKKDWHALGDVTEQNQLPSETINKAIKKHHQSYFNKTILIESMIILSFLYFIVLIIFRFNALEKVYLELIAIVTIMILSTLCIIRILKIKNLSYQKYFNQSPTDVLKQISKQNIRDRKYYFLNMTLGFVLIIMLATLNLKIYREYDLIQDKNFWFFLVSSSLIFIFMTNKWIKSYHEHVISETKDLIKELN